MRFIGKLLKFIFKTILWLIIIALILGVILYLSAGKLIQHLAPTYISQITQTESSLGEVDISLFSGRIAVHNLEIGNPVGYKNKNAFELEKLAINFDPKNVLAGKIIINNVKIDGLNVASEAKASGETNISRLINNVNKSLGSNTQGAATPETKPTQQAQSSKQPAVIIKDLKIDNSSVDFALSGIPGVPKEALAVNVPLPDIQMKNIGEKKRQTLGETVIQVLNTINAEVVKASITATKEATQKAIQGGKDRVNSFTDTLKNLF